MREFTKSMFRFSWAMCLFGVQQSVNLMKPDEAANSFENVTDAVENDLDGFLKDFFKAGTNIQGKMIDLTFDTFTGKAFNPNFRPQKPENSGVNEISPDYPFKPHYVDVFGSKMHYIDEGAGDPILFLHGNPTWSYIWRNIIPHLVPHGRCIAPDLIGFGRSDKPAIDYSWFDHSNYLEQFIEQLGLKNITLVLHDQGSGLGFHYAMRNEHKIKRIAFFEAIVKPFAWEEFSTPDFRQLFQIFRNGGIGSQGWQMIVEQNFFIEQLLPQAAGRPLSPKEMDFYREPFGTPQSRIPIWKFTRETPIGGEPKDVWRAASEYSARLQKSGLPKLMLYAEPGALLTKENVDWCKRNIDNLESVNLGAGAHFLQESSPGRIGSEIARWMRRC